MNPLLKKFLLLTLLLRIIGPVSLATYYYVQHDVTKERVPETHED